MLNQFYFIWFHRFSPPHTFADAFNKPEMQISAVSAAVPIDEFDTDGILICQVGTVSPRRISTISVWVLRVYGEKSFWVTARTCFEKIIQDVWRQYLFFITKNQVPTDKGNSQSVATSSNPGGLSLWIEILIDLRQTSNIIFYDKWHNFFNWILQLPERPQVLYVLKMIQKTGKNLFSGNHEPSTLLENKKQKVGKAEVDDGAFFGEIKDR